MPPLPPPPQYTLLPDKPLSDNKPGLERTVSDSPRSTTSPSHPSRTRKLLLVATGALAITVLASALYATNLVMLNGCHTSESRRARAGTSAELPPQFERQRLEKRADAAAPEKEHPKFSTHTYTDEEGTSTSTFVYETTPIINPGGFTIGTLTGYVVVKPTTTLPAKDNVVTSATTSSSTSTTPTASPTYSTTTNTDGETSTFVYTTKPIVNPGGFTIGTLTGYVPLTTVPPSSTASASVAAASPTPAPEPAFDFYNVDAHLLHRRGEDFEEGRPNLEAYEEEEPDVSTVQLPASEEYSYQTRHGTTNTYVKTTRPIVNPGGFTIGTLNGVYVKPDPTSAPSHDELRS